MKIKTPMLLIWGSAVGLILSYASKFSFFDPAKEILISKLPSEDRRISKVLTDGLSGRAGKISSGILQSTLLSISTVNSILDLIPIILCFVSAISILFINCSNRLKRKYNQALPPASPLQTI